MVSNAGGNLVSFSAPGRGGRGNQGCGASRPPRKRLTTWSTSCCNARPAAQRLDRLEDTVLNLSNMMAQFVTTMTNAHVVLARAIATPLGTQANSAGLENKAPVQTAQGSQAA